MKRKIVSVDKVNRVAKLPGAVTKFYSEVEVNDTLYDKGFKLRHTFGVFIEHDGFVYETEVNPLTKQMHGTRTEYTDLERRLNRAPTGITLEEMLSTGTNIRKNDKYSINVIAFKKV